MKTFLVVMAAAVMVMGKPTSHMKHKGGDEGHMKHGDGEGHMKHGHGGEGHMNKEHMDGDSMMGSWGMKHENCSMEESRGMGGRRNCSTPSLPMVFQRMHVMHLCEGKPEEEDCSLRAHHCMDWLDLGMGNGQDYLPNDNVCTEGDAECLTMYQQCLNLLTPAENTPQVSHVSVICAVQDHPECLERMPGCVAMLYPGRAAPIMPPKGEVVCQGHEDMEQCIQMVRECRQMMMPFTRMIMKMGPEGMMSMVPGGMKHGGMKHDGMENTGMEHDGMMPYPRPEPEPMGEGMPMPPACREFMNECVMLMRPGPAGPLSEAEACEGMEGAACSKKYNDCHALMNQEQHSPPPEMPEAAHHLCKHMTDSMEGCVAAAMMCHEKMKPTKSLVHGNMTHCLTRSSPCPKFPSSPEEHISLMMCMEPVLRAHLGASLMIPLEAMGEHGSESTDTIHSPNEVHDTAAYNACFLDNDIAMDVVKCTMMQCIKEMMAS